MQGRLQKQVGCNLLVVGVLVLVIIGIGLLCVWLAMLLWNAVCHGVFGWPTLTYWQMFGLMLLISLLGAGIREVCSPSR